MITLQETNRAWEDQHSSPKEVTRLFCFHWCGGNGNSFRCWANTLSALIKTPNSHIDIFGVTWRSTEKSYERIEDVVKDLREAFLESQLLSPETKNIFFGHSVGGTIAFELIRELESEGFYKVSALIVSAIRPPPFLSRRNDDETIRKHHLDSEHELFSHTEEIGGLPPGVHPDFLRLSLRDIRDDYRLIETYSYGVNLCSSAGNPNGITIPITTMIGAGDLEVAPGLMAGWSEMTTSTTTHRHFNDVTHADHFYLTKPRLRLELLSTLRDTCASVGLPMSPDRRSLYKEDYRDVHQGAPPRERVHSFAPNPFSRTREF